MLRQLRKTDSEQGIVLIIVLIVLMVMAIVSMTIFSQSMSQSKSARAQIDQITAEQLAKGGFWAAFSNTSSSSTAMSTSFPLNGRTFTLSVPSVSSGSNLTATVSY